MLIVGDSVIVDDERCELGGDGQRRKESGDGTVFAAGWKVCGVLFGADVTRVEGDTGFGGQGMDATENVVDLLVWATPIPPPFHNAGVIAVEVEMWGFVAWGGDEGTSKEFEANGLGPSDVPELRFPSVDKPPCSPARANDNGNTNAGAGVGVGCNVDDLRF